MKVREKSVGKSSSHKSQTSDVVIIGAGIIGLAIAYSLLRAGKSVRIIERSKPGIGQSTKTGGGIRLAHGSELNIQLTQLSFDTWLNFEEYFKFSYENFKDFMEKISTSVEPISTTNTRRNL